MAHPHIIPPTPAQYRQDVLDVRLAHAPAADPCPVCGWAKVVGYECPTCDEG